MPGAGEDNGEFEPPKEQGRPPPNPVYDKEPYPGEQAKKVQFRPFYWKYELGAKKEVNILGIVYRWREDEVFERLNILPFVYYTKRKLPQELASWFLWIFPSFSRATTACSSSRSAASRAACSASTS